MPTAYRLTQQRYAQSAFSGAGSLRGNGRWHRAGIPIVYAAESAAVALLEVMVHLERPRLLVMDWAVVPCRFEDALGERMDALPDDWRVFPWPASTQQIGQAWFEAQRSPVLDVRSAVMPSARNYLLNPEHPRFGEVEIGEAEPFEIDTRLGS